MRTIACATTRRVFGTDRSGGERQTQNERRAGAVGFRAQTAALSFGEAPGDVQAEAAARRLIGAIREQPNVWFEYRLELIGRDASATVDDADSRQLPIDCQRDVHVSAI